MSLRWNVLGVRLHRLWEQLGSGDESLLSRLTSEFVERVRHSVECNWFDADDAEEYRAQVGTILSRAVRDGAPFAELGGENSVHVDVANALACDGQTLLRTDSPDWKHGAWFQFEKEVGPRLAIPDRQLLTWLVHGRPIFGQRFDTGWDFYPYLSNAEARTLRGALAAAVAAGPPVRIAADRDFAGELLGWLDEIVGRGLDVWVDAD